MHRRKQTLCSFLPLAASLLTSVGCAVNQQPRFQNAFLPPPRPGDPALRVELEDYPVVQPNVYLTDLPAFLIATPDLPPRKTRGDTLVQRAEARFEAGKRYYQSQDIENARREFDAAVDLMLDASDQNPADRQDYERRAIELATSPDRLSQIRKKLAGIRTAAPLFDVRAFTRNLEALYEVMHRRHLSGLPPGHLENGTP